MPLESFDHPQRGEDFTNLLGQLRITLSILFGRGRFTISATGNEFVSERRDRMMFGMRDVRIHKNMSCRQMSAFA